MTQYAVVLFAGNQKLPRLPQLKPTYRYESPVRRGFKKGYSDRMTGVPIDYLNKMSEDVYGAFLQGWRIADNLLKGK